jgi:hypothetical protein
VVSDAGPLIHLAQINKVYLIKKIFSQVEITPKVMKEAYGEGVKLGHPDAQIIGKAIEEGWVIVEEIPKGLASASKRLAEGEKYLRQMLGRFGLQGRRERKFWLTRKHFRTLQECMGLKHGTLGLCF